MDHIQQRLQNDSQSDPSKYSSAQPNLAPPGPLPMVFQNPLPHQGMVATQPLDPQAPITTITTQSANAGVHHFMT